MSFINFEIYFNYRKFKICGECGYSESTNWSKHWKKKHKNTEPYELEEGKEPVKPWCENWKQIVYDKIKTESDSKSILGKRPLDNDDKTVTDDTIFEQQASAVQRTETTNETKLLLDKKFNQFDQII